MNRKNVVELFATSFRDWQEDSIPVRAAALTFFIILPLPSLLLIVVTIFEVFYGKTQALQFLIQLISLVTGPAVADLFRTLLSSALSPFSSVWTAFTIIVFSVGGAIGAFAVLRETMDTIWGYKALRRRKLVNRIRRWIGPFVVVSSLGLIVIASTAIATLIFDGIRALPINLVLTRISLSILEILFSFIVSTLLFAIIYKVIPEAKVHWRDVVLASSVAGLAFTVANYIIGTYIATFTVTTIVGTAGSLFIILLWIYILNQIALFGAEVSRVYATTFGSHAKEHVVMQIIPMEKPIEPEIKEQGK
jgi:membrane protein